MGGSASISGTILLFCAQLLAWALLCQSPSAPVHTKQQHLILGSFLSAEHLAAAPWGQKEKSVLTSFFRVKTHFFVLTELNQLVLAHKTSKSGISQLLSEIINANHLWFVCIRVHSPSCSGGSTEAFKTSILISNKLFQIALEI